MPKNNRTKKETTTDESNLGFKNGMLGKFVWKKQANIKKGKGRKKKDKETQNSNVFQKGVDGQKAKNEFWKGTQKENQKRKQNRKKRRILKTGLSGTQKRKKTLKLQDNSIFVFVFPNK